MAYTLIVEPTTQEARNAYSAHSTFHAGDAGIDLFVLNDTTIGLGKATLVSHDIKCKMIDPAGNQCSYLLYPRSSISNLPLMMANHTGVIDAAYRGLIKGPLRYLPFADERVEHPDFGKSYTIEKGTRVFQICAPTLGPINLVVLPENEHLDETTRGTGGFGSTGK